MKELKDMTFESMFMSFIRKNEAIKDEKLIESLRQVFYAGAATIVITVEEGHRGGQQGYINAACLLRQWHDEIAAYARNRSREEAMRN
jgi:hypothetical protein